MASYDIVSQQCFRIKGLGENYSQVNDFYASYTYPSLRLGLSRITMDRLHLHPRLGIFQDRNLLALRQAQAETLSLRPHMGLRTRERKRQEKSVD